MCTYFRSFKILASLTKSELVFKRIFISVDTEILWNSPKRVGSQGFLEALNLSLSLYKRYYILLKRHLRLFGYNTLLDNQILKKDPHKLFYRD